jgi:hypothetical protein
MPALRQPPAGVQRAVTEPKLREALAVRERRRVRRDTTVSVLGCIYELQQGFLAGKVVDRSAKRSRPAPDSESANRQVC